MYWVSCAANELSILVLRREIWLKIPGKSEYEIDSMKISECKFKIDETITCFHYSDQDDCLLLIKVHR